MKICGGSELFQKILNVAGYTHGIVVDPDLLFVAPGQDAVETLRRDYIFSLFLSQSEGTCFAVDSESH